MGCSCEPATAARLGSAGRPTTTLGGSAEVPTLAACRADRGEHERRLGPQPSRSVHQPRVEPTQAGPLAAPRRVRSPRAPSGVVDVSALAEHPSVVAAVPAAQGGSPTGTRRGEDSAVSTPSRGVLQWVVVASRPRQPGSVLPAVPPPRWEARPRCRLWRRAELTVASTSGVLDPSPAAHQPRTSHQS